MVKYGFAAGVLLVMTIGSIDCFAPATSLSSSLRQELRIGLRRDVSSPALYDPGFDPNDLNSAFRNVSADYLDSLSEALSNEDDADEVVMALKKKIVKDRVANSLGNYKVSLALTSRMGMTLCQVNPGLTLSGAFLNVDTLRFEASPLLESNENIATIDLDETKKMLGDKFRGLLVSSVEKEGRAWKAGIRPGDVLLSTSATMGDSMWPKSTLEGVRSAISSRKVVSGMMDFQLQRTGITDNNIAKTYELTLTKPIGIEIEETSDGYVLVTGINKNAPKLVKYAIEIGDRILAIDSTIGGSMWPVSTTSGVISACTSRLPGQSITIRFERPGNLTNQASSAAVETTPINPTIATKSSVLSTSGTKTETLLKRCRDVLRKYQVDEQQNARQTFSDKYSVPALVADKVLDAVASASIPLDAKTLCMIMNAYLSCKQPDRAIRAFEGSVGILSDGSFCPSFVKIEGKERGTLIPNLAALNLFTVSSLMRSLSLRGDIESVRRFLVALEEKSGIDANRAIDWPFTEIRNPIVPDSQLYNIALSAAARSGTTSSLTELMTIFDRMADKTQTGGKPSKDVVSYNTVINALTRGGQFNDAFATFYRMKRAGIKPDKFTYTSLIKACVQEGDMQELLLDMQATGVKPDLVMYNFMIRTLCEGGKVFEAKKFVTQMEASGIAPDSMTYSFLMNGLLVANKPSACLSLFEAACAESKTILLTENVHLFTTAITAASALENHEKAFHLITRMEIAGIKPNLKTKTALMGACMSSGKYQLAVDVYKKIDKPDAIAMCKGVEALCLSNQFKEAMEILSSKDSTKQLSGKQLMIAHGHLLQNSLIAGNMDVAREAFKAFLGAGFIPSKTTYLLIIQALGLIPPKKRNLPFAKAIPEQHFSFLLFVLDSIQDRNLTCDSFFYSSVLMAGSRLGGLRRKVCSLLTESRQRTEDQQRLTYLDENPALHQTEIRWEELLDNYDRYKARLGTEILLPLITVRMGKDDVRQVFAAEQEVTYKGVERRRAKVIM